MGGLAIGNGLVGMLGHRVRRPLRVYAAAEFVVAIAGVSLTYLLSARAALVGPAVGLDVDRLLLVNALRLAIAFLALLVPATAMGVTLPLLVGEMCRRRPGF